jgi:hypothetical protein
VAGVPALRLSRRPDVDFFFWHDGSRVEQWMQGDGDEAQVAGIVDELLVGARSDVEGVRAGEAGDGVRDFLMGGESGAPFFVRLASDRYGRHLATKMLRVSVRVVRYRGVLFESCLKGNTAVMMRNAYGADVLDFAFQATLNAAQRAELVVELLFSRERKILEVVRRKLAGGKTGWKASINVALAACGGDFRDIVVENAGLAPAGFVDKPAPRDCACGAG